MTSKYQKKQSFFFLIRNAKVVRKDCKIVRVRLSYTTTTFLIPGNITDVLSFDNKPVGMLLILKYWKVSFSRNIKFSYPCND